MKYLIHLVLFLNLSVFYGQQENYKLFKYKKLLTDVNYFQKEELFKRIDQLKSNNTNDWIAFFEKERENKKDFITQEYILQTIIIDLHKTTGDIIKANDIALNYYYSSLDKLEKKDLCDLLVNIEKNCIVLNQTINLILINKEKLKVCKPEQVDFYNIYTKLDLHDSALESYRNKYKKDLEDNTNNIKKGMHYNNIGVFFKRDLNIDSALYYFNKSLHIVDDVIAKTQKNNLNLRNYYYCKGMIQGNLGDCYLSLEKYNLAIDQFKAEAKAAKIYYKNIFWFGENKFYENMAIAHIKIKKQNEADIYINLLKKDKVVYNKLKYVYFESLKKYDSANYYSLKYIKQKDSLRDTNIKQNNKSIVKILDFIDDVVEQRKIIQNINNQNNSKEIKIKVIYFIAVALLIIVLILSFLFIKLSKQKKIISKQNKAIKNTLSEKNILLSELHHRVKNNLQIMSSILNLQLSKLQSADLKEVFQYSINRINVLSRVQSKLLANESLSKISLRNYVLSIINELKSVYETMEEINFTTKIDPNLFIHIDQTQTIGLITNELLTNSLKHAFKNNIECKIKIEIHNKKNEVSYKYSDNGKGFDILSIKKTSSIGLSLIFKLIKQLDTVGELVNNNGMQISFTFKNKLKL